MTVSILSRHAKLDNGGTPARSNESFFTGSIPWITAADIDMDGHIVPRWHITDAAVAASSTKVFPCGTIVLVTRTSVGKVGILPEAMAINQDLTAIQPLSELDGKYLAHFLRANSQKLIARSRGVTIKGVTRQAVGDLGLSLPPLPEQRRIAAILDRADALRARRRQVLAHLDSLTQSVFHEMFGGVVPDATVGDVAEIQGGLQVSSKRAALPVAVQYLRVANAHRGRLDLAEVKSLQATQKEIDRTRLRRGDLLFVEGHANPKEVGRVAMWNGELEVCVHQNHLIRGRLDPSDALPAFLMTWLNTQRGANHFFQAGNTTSGLNTISASTVRSAPVPLVPIQQQRQFVERIGKLHVQCGRAGRAAASHDELFASLQSRAFKGEL